jgi:hypothetical protein
MTSWTGVSSTNVTLRLTDAVSITPAVSCHRNALFPFYCGLTKMCVLHGLQRFDFSI